MFSRFKLDDEVYVWDVERFGNKHTIWRGAVSHISSDNEYLTIKVYPLEGLVEETVVADYKRIVYLADEFEVHLGKKN